MLKISFDGICYGPIPVQKFQELKVTFIEGSSRGQEYVFAPGDARYINIVATGSYPAEAPYTIQAGPIHAGNESQKSITEWATQTFGSRGPLRTFTRCHVEFAELGGVLEQFASAEDYHTRELYRQKAIEEVADVQIILSQIMEKLGGDMITAVNEKMRINRERKWKRLESGRSQHEE